MISTLKEVRDALHKARRQITHADVSPHQCIAEAITKLDALISAQEKAEPVAWRMTLTCPIPWVTGKPSELDLRHWKSQDCPIEYAYATPQPAPSTSPLTWQPIETAPQSESEPFLVFVPLDDVADGVVIQVSWFEGRMYPDAKDAAVNWDDAIQNATYWMPLPDAPAHGIGAKP